VGHESSGPFAANARRSGVIPERGAMGTCR
jgi:hypothetical protein